MLSADLPRTRGTPALDFHGPFRPTVEVTQSWAWALVSEGTPHPPPDLVAVHRTVCFICCCVSSTHRGNSTLGPLTAH